MNVIENKPASYNIMILDKKWRPRYQNIQDCHSVQV